MINPMEFVKAEKRGESVIAIVHSHADVGDYFSSEDIAGALIPGNEDGGHHPDLRGRLSGCFSP